MSVEAAMRMWGDEADARIATFSAALKKWRLTGGLTSGRAAGRLGVTHDRYRLLEDGLIDPFDIAPAQAMAIIRGTGLEGAELALNEDSARGSPSACAGGGGASGGAAPSPNDGAEARFQPWRVRGWRVGLGRLPETPGAYGVTLDLARTVLTPEQAVELAAEIFKEAALARA